MIETNKVKKECYLMKQDNIKYKFSINISFSSIGHDKSKLQKQCKLLKCNYRLLKVKVGNNNYLFNDALNIF